MNERIQRMKREKKKRWKREKEEEKEKQVAHRQYIVIGTLALLYFRLKSKGSRAAVAIRSSIR